ncbi:MAG: hypothetical protein NT045_06565 [Candidatus Aureabacteria bacterium]|nr:hypothetical protein [Candidatus Auribacterota bacterium]
MDARRLGWIVALIAMSGACTTWGQPTEDVQPREEEIKQEVAGAGVCEKKEQCFLMNHIPPLEWTNRVMDRVDEVSPLKFGAESRFESNWLNEGGNWAKNGVQIEQTYFTEWTRTLGDFEGGAGFEYYQIDSTWRGIKPSTMERDFTPYVPLSWKVFSLEPYWKYIYIDGADAKDYQEIGSAFTIDVPLKPTFYWNHDFSVYTGTYCEWSISHDIAIAPTGEQVVIFTPSMAIGMDAHKYQEHTTLTHIDWGLDLSVPLNRHFVLTGMLHFTKSLAHGDYSEENDVFHDILPWGGLKLSMEF